jgi:hypothetical protein
VDFTTAVQEPDIRVVRLRGVDLGGPSLFWDCGFESCWGLGCLSVVSVVFNQVEVSATVRSLTQRMCVYVSVSLSVIRGNSKSLHLQRLGRRGQTGKERKKESYGLSGNFSDEANRRTVLNFWIPLLSLALFRRVRKLAEIDC